MSSRHPPLTLDVKKSKENATSPSLPTLGSAASLTPPLTPVTPDGSSLTSCAVQGPPLPIEQAKNVTRTEPVGQYEVTTPREFIYDLEIRKDPDGACVEYGRGVWSVVYSASTNWTDPQSHPQEYPPDKPPSNSVLAVKSAVRRDAREILQSEALLLTKLSRIPGSEHYIVPFHGFIPQTASIVMSAVPLTLSAYIVDKTVEADKIFSTRTMFDPVVGMSSWLSLAYSLVRGLDWLHSCGRIVHGDMKPHNILLKPRVDIDSLAADNDLAYEPIYVDFTSSYDITRDSPLHDKHSCLSALTPPFAAPELLTVQALNSDTAPSTASDVFSLAATLLAAVTGDLLLYPGSNHIQRLAMAKEGHRVLEYVRTGTHGSRLPRNGVVEKVLSPAVVKEPASRIHTIEWLRLIQDTKV